MDKDKDIKNENNETNLLNEDSFQDVEFIDSTEDGEVLPTKDVTKKLREELKKVQKERDEYLTGWQRAKADYINLQKELEQARVSISLITKERIVGELLPALDSFDMAFSNKEAWEKVDPNWRMGVEYIYTSLMKGLEDSGVEKINKIGIIFDPLIHQSIEVVSTDDKSKDHTIEKIIQIGYKIADKVIRPAKVNIYEYKKE